MLWKMQLSVEKRNHHQIHHLKNHLKKHTEAVTMLRLVPEFVVSLSILVLNLFMDHFSSITFFSLKVTDIYNKNEVFE